MNEFAYVNTDKEIWREIEGDYYAPSIHVTSYGKIGINVGGTVHIKDVRDWHSLAEEEWKAEEVTVDSELALVEGTQASEQVIEMFAALSRKIVSLERQLADTQRNLERHAEELENAKHRISKHAEMVEMLTDDVITLDERTQVINAINKYYAEGCR